jgi:Nucleotidyltransferase
MNKDEFLAAALRNPVNRAIADELYRLALPDAWLVSGCLVQSVWNVLTARAVDHGIADYDIFYFDPDTSWTVEDAVIRQLPGRLRHAQGQDRGAQSGARPSLVRRKARPALSTAHLLDRGHRPLPDQKYPGRNPPCRGWLQGLRAQWIRRHRRPDRAAQSVCEFLGRKL